MLLATLFLTMPAWLIFLLSFCVLGGMALGQHQGAFDAAAIADIQNGFPFTGLFEEFAQDNVAAAGANQAGATPCIAQTIRVTSGSGGILLPPSAAGLELLVINHSGASLQVYGAGSDTIDDQVAATGVAQMNNSLVIYTCASQGKWYSEGLSTGFEPGPGLQTLSFVDGLTAHAGGGQAAALALTKLLNRIATVGSANDSVVLPPAIPGLEITVANGAGANSMNVFPASQAQGGATGGDAINALGQNAAFAMAAGAINIFYCFTAGQWFTK